MQLLVQSCLDPSRATEIFSVPNQRIFLKPKIVHYRNKSGLQYPRTRKSWDLLKWVAFESLQLYSRYNSQACLCCSGGASRQLPASRDMRISRKRFYFDIGSNERGVFMRMSEVNNAPPPLFFLITSESYSFAEAHHGIAMCEEVRVSLSPSVFPTSCLLPSSAASFLPSPVWTVRAKATEIADIFDYDLLLFISFVSERTKYSSILT